MLPPRHDFHPRDLGQGCVVLKKLVRHHLVQAGLARLLAAYLGFALSTTRWRVVGQAHFDAYQNGAPVIAAFWHEHLPLMPALWRRAQKATPGLKLSVLVSRHNDGRFIGEVVARFGLSLAYGSSSHGGRDRGGAAAALTLIEELRAGHQVALTPDGPRGPRRKAAAGVAQLAALSGVAVLPCAALARPCRVLPTWDRMVLPLPFARGVLVCGAPINVARDDAQNALPLIAQALKDVAEEAERLCRD